ncbi:5-hydroxyisourate hydrolase [Condylostylus longicornis]|uniref:5-hydroxyisourate hydrolase n=1 Tax=Condylostylus longicornis TaxID=2530218 RepID=UPI00244E5752|nr:5-hydroxyisourate hydrolase [Condylostylus longicornis]
MSCITHARYKLRVQEGPNLQKTAARMSKITISTHILDTSRGLAADNVPVTLYKLQETTNEWRKISQSATNDDGRCPELIIAEEFEPGYYKLNFDTSDYFKRYHTRYLYPFVEIVFECGSKQHYHIPLLLNPFGYSTYRGT